MVRIDHHPLHPARRIAISCGDAGAEHIAEAREALIARFDHVVRVAAHIRLAVLGTDLAEFGGEHRVNTPAFQLHLEKVLVVSASVHVGRVAERDTQVERPVDRLDGAMFVALAAGDRHAHAPDADRRHLKRTEFMRLHVPVSRLMDHFALTSTPASRIRFITGQRYSTFC